MKSNSYHLSKGLVVAACVLLTNLVHAALTDYGAIPQIAQPPQDQSAANQKLDFHTDLFTGRFGYEVPVEVPPGRGGSEPSVALQYSSANKDGLCGVGWDVDMGSIQRETRYGVPVSGGAYSDAFGFTFSFGGHSGRLVSVGGGNYYPQINTDFLKFNYSNSTWIVTDKDGKKYNFGETTASRITTSYGVFKWGLSSTRDANGNHSYLTYTNDSGQMYPQQINYNGNDNSPAIATNCTVIFDLSNRFDRISSAISGTEITTTKFMTGIRVMNQGSLVRRYALAYIASPSTTHALLQSVTEYGSDNTTALPAKTFSYSVQQQGFASPVLWSIVSQTTLGDTWGISPATPDSQLIDMNGDGLPDRVVHPNGASYFLIQYNTGTGFTSQYTWSPVGNENGNNTSAWMDLDSADSHMVDINGDGLPDRVVNQLNQPFDHIQVQTNNGSGFSSSIYDWSVSCIFPNYEGHSVNDLNVPYALTSDDVSSLTTLVDLNGDGLPDRVMSGSTAGQFDVQLNTGNGFSSSIYAWNYVTAYGTRTDNYYSPRARDNNIVYSDLVDMNGDGLPDRVIDTGSPYFFIEVQINNGAGSFGSPESWNLDNAYPGEIDTGTGAYNAMLIDMNGDGLPDWVYFPSTAYGGGDYTVFLNSGTGFGSGVTWSGVSIGSLGLGGDAPQAWDSNGTRAEMIDMNGDGLPDRVMRYPNPGYASDYLEIQFNKGPFPDLLVTANNGIGGSIGVTYTNSTIYFNPDSTFPRMPSPVYVVTSVTANDGRGNSGTTSYAYSGPHYDHTFREFRGFYEVTETDPLGAFTFNYFHQGGGNSWNGSSLGEYNDDIAKSGMPFRVESYGSDSKLYSRTMNLVNEVLLYNGGNQFNDVYFPFVQQTIKQDYEGNTGYRASAVGYAYSAIAGNITNSTGNLLSQTNYGEVASVTLSSQTFTTGVSGAPPPVYEQYTYATITSNPDIRDKPASVTVSADAGGSTVLQQTLYTYFGVTGNLEQKSDLICPTSYAVTAYTYDNYGNVATITDPISIVTTLSYDATATFPVRKYTGTLANNLIEYTQFDPRSGALLAETNEQGLVMANLYDVFFRLTNSATSTNANGAATLWRKQIRYGLGGIVSNNSSNYVRLWENDPADTVNGYHEIYTYLDGLGRPIQTRDEAETGQYRVSDLVYDARGATMLEDYPIFQSGGGYSKPSGTRTNVYTQFDPIGRTFKINPCASASFNSSGFLSGTPSVLSGDTGSPVGSTSFDYNDGSNPWAIVVTNALGKIHKYYQDAFGRTNQIVEVTSGGNFTTTLAYDLIDDLTNITDNANNKISFYFDDLKNEVAMTDPDMGFWQFARDADGNLKVQTDAKGQQLKFYYSDPAGRLTRREGYNVAGQLVSTNTYSYDSNGGDSSYTVYPGQLFMVTDDQGWQKSNYDVRNRTPKIVRYLSKNGSTYTNQYAFDDADRQNSIIYPNGGPTITNIFDTGENLSQVKQVGGSNTVYYAAQGFNALRQLLGVNFGNGIVTTNSYYPVSLRLQKILTSKSSNLQSLTYTFDAIGNVKGVTDGVYSGLASATFGNIVYDDLNRLTSLTNASGSFAYGFDSVGNVLTNKESGSGTYSYGTIRPHAVKNANGVWLTYDQNGNVANRNGMRLVYDVNNHMAYAVTPTNLTQFGYDGDGVRLWEQSSTNTLQVWIGNDYEEKNGQILFHVYAGGRQVCTFDKTGTNVFQYYHPDDLTSTSIQTDQNGNQIQNYGYSAFGQSRYTQSSTVFKVSRRYTGQVLDDATGLYYYNARYYDPQLGRFTQPDDTIPDFSDPQSYNRYAYCVNNPLRFTDPSGHDSGDDDDLDNIPMTVGGASAMLRQQQGGASAQLYTQSKSDMGGMANAAKAAVDLTPVGTANNAYQAVTGRDAMNPDQKLTGGQQVGSGLAAGASLVPVGKIIKTGASIVKDTARGLANEAKVLKEMGLAKNAEKVSTAEGNAIPDALTGTTSLEIKDSKVVNRTKQIRIQTGAAQESQRQSVLVTGTKTQISGPAQKSFDKIIQRPDLGPQK
jgi:RHS repeat-associated protein